MRRTKEQLAYDASKIRWQLSKVYNTISNIECTSINIDVNNRLFEDDNDTFMKVNNDIDLLYDLIYSLRSNMRDFSKNHFDAYLYQESQ